MYLTLTIPLRQDRLFVLYYYQHPMLPIKKLPEILEAQKILTKDDIAKFTTEAECKTLTLEECILKKRVVAEDLLYKAAAKYYNLPYVSLIGQIIPREVLSIITEPIAQTHKLIPYAKEKDVIKIAVLNPDDTETIEFIQKKTGAKVELAITDPDSLKAGLKQYRQSLETEFAEIVKRAPGKSDEELAKEAPIVRIVDALMEHAILRGASDIHIEPREKDVTARFRIDGVLHEAMMLPKEVHMGVVARIKILANLKIDEHRVPQDGRFKVQIPNYKVSVRTSIFPMFDGEKIVMRILHEDTRAMTIEELGFAPKQYEIIMRNIKKPHGIILVTGPTGSGKTTTLYAFITHLNRPQVNISTIEDPIEYRILGVNQSQVNPKVGFTFATGLRSLLRQDPNIIMIGEIRDAETADIAINAALTGHLVLSTLHTNDAVTALPRLLDLGIPSFLIAQTADLITAQRLVRKTCQHCLMSYTLTREMVQELEKQFDMPAVLATLAREGVLTESKTKLEGMRFVKGAGCPMCGDTGYKGRIAVHEVLEVSHEIAELIYNKAPVENLRQAARTQGMLTLLEDAFLKAKEGLTTIEEIVRVTKE